MNESNISKLIVTAGNWTRYFTDEVRGEFNDIDFVICGNLFVVFLNSLGFD